MQNGKRASRRVAPWGVVAACAAAFAVSVRATDFDTFKPDPTGATDMSALLQEAVRAAAKSGCRTLLSEDLQDGFELDGLTVLNPFTE